MALFARLFHIMCFFKFKCFVCRSDGTTIAVLTAVMVLLAVASTAPMPRSLMELISIDTTGLELPMDFISSMAPGSGTMQIVINIHTDSNGNIQISQS